MVFAEIGGRDASVLQFRFLFPVQTKVEEFS